MPATYIRENAEKKNTTKEVRGLIVEKDQVAISAIDCKTDVFESFRKAGSAVSLILYRLSSFSLAILHSLQTFRSIMVRRSRSQKIRLFCSLSLRQLDCSVMRNKACRSTTLSFVLEICEAESTKPAKQLVFRFLVAVKEFSMTWNWKTITEFV